MEDISDVVELKVELIHPKDRTSTSPKKCVKVTLDAVKLYTEILSSPTLSEGHLVTKSMCSRL